MTKYLILVKHSMPEMEQDRPANTWKLSEEGQRRAQRLAEHLKEYGAEAIVSSAEPKAKQTADIIARQLGLSVKIVPNLHEHDRANVPFLPHDTFQASIRDFFQKPDELVFGIETANEAYTRFYGAVHSILNEYSKKTVVVVTHGTVISLFVSRLTGSSDHELWNLLGLPSYVALDLESSEVIVKNKIV
jgi:broad specificity phosphatase PhoE